MNIKMWIIALSLFLLVFAPSRISVADGISSLSLNCAVYESDLVAHVRVVDLDTWKAKPENGYPRGLTMATAHVVALESPFKGKWPQALTETIKINFPYSGMEGDPFTAQMLKGKEYVAFIKKVEDAYEYASPQSVRSRSYFENFDGIKEAVELDSLLEKQMKNVSLTLDIEPKAVRPDELPILTLKLMNNGADKIMLPCNFKSSEHISPVGPTRIYVEEVGDERRAFGLPRSYSVQWDVPPIEIPGGMEMVWRGKRDLKKIELPAQKLRYTWYVRGVASNSVELTILHPDENDSKKED